MALTHGADTRALISSVARLDGLARDCSGAVTEMSSAASRLRAAWGGPDADGFQRRAASSAREVEAVAEAVRCMARTVRRQARGQDAVSDDDGVGLAATAPAPAPTTPAVPPSPVTPPRPLDELVPPPRLSTSPTDNARWWGRLTEAERAAVLAGHPGWLGNRDGIPFDVRDEANRAYLPVLRADLEAQHAALLTGRPDRTRRDRGQAGLARRGGAGQRAP